MDDEAACITVCQGPPRCDLVGDDAITAIRAGCPWCSRIYVHADGREEVIEPGNA